MANRFEQVEERQEDAVTLFLIEGSSGDCGYITCPAAITHGAMAEDQVTPEMPARDAFRSAIHLANSIKAPMVVVDPHGLWQVEWGELFREDETT